jgi:hypothetical protein
MLVQDQKWNWLDHLFFLTCGVGCLISLWMVAEAVSAFWGWVFRG